MKIFYTPRCLEYQLPGHPESPERVRSVHDYLEKEGYLFEDPVACTDDDVLRVHSRDLLQAVKSETFFDGDTPTLPKIANYALFSAGAAIQAAQSADTGETGFSLMRPPGHHATRDRVMGFCYFNNIAIASAAFLSDHPEERVAILDIDCHHGNGTEDIFRGNSSLLYVSLHQSPLYPGTGHASAGNILNFPLPPFTSEASFLDALDEACQGVQRFEPSLLGISAGFDTFSEDPLTQMMLDVPSYEKIGERIMEMSLPTFVILEGGYSAKLPECVLAFVQGLES